MIDYLLGYLPQNPFWFSVSTLGILSAISFTSFFIAKNVVLRLIRNLLKRGNTNLGNMLADNNVFYKLTYLIPVFVFYKLSYVSPLFEKLIIQISLGAMAFVALLMFNAFLYVLEEIYQKTNYSEHLNIKSYLQIIKLVANILGLVVIVAISMDKDPTLLLSGIGAMTAVLMLIFKDTILSLVASMQITSNDLFKVGDWIEAPQFSADGDVIEIALHSVKIQNFDKTISVIPTHKFIDSPFKNWRNMYKSGGRRIKRSLFIDMSTIKLCDQAALHKFSKFKLLSNYIDLKGREIDTYNVDKDVSELINGRSLTNVGVFRVYIENYLKINHNIHKKGMTFLVRQLEPTALGLPIQLYVFVNDTNWVRYESVQADIFDHLLAVVPEFDLKIFQSPAGSDFSRL
jgi:miniconductance mechanosensitive channel